MTDEKTIAKLRKKQEIVGPMFRMHDFLWQLSFKVDFNDVANNPVMMLNLVSLPPKVKKITAAYTMFFDDLDVRYTKSNAFENDGDKFAWAQGQCDTEDVMKLSSFAFGVELQLAAVYNHEDQDIVDQYIANSGKSAIPPTAPSSNIMESLQALTARVDSLAAAVEAIQIRLGEEEKENTNDLQQQIDEIKATLQKLTVKSDVIEDNTEEAIFKKWVVNTLKYPEYYELFVENGVDTLNVAKLLTKSELKAIGINKSGHQLKIMECIQALKQSEDKPPAPAYQQPVEGGTLMM